ncbi:hypothetical protein PENTCL1PPCAC_11003, partial [Pristionchus entomophagus]
DLTSPRRSSRNHASTLALDVAMSMTCSLKDGVAGGEGGGEEAVIERKKGPRDSSASSSTSKRSSVRKNGEKKMETRGKRRAGAPPSDAKRRRKRSETEEEESSEEEDDELEQELDQKPRANDFSVSRLIGEEEPQEDKKRLDMPDDDALPFPTSVLFCEDALGKVDASQYPPNCTQFNIGGIKYLPLSCLMDDDGFTVSINEPVTYHKTDGKKHSASLSEALKHSGLSVKRRILGKELLHVLRIAGLVVHWAFVGQLSPPLLKQLQQERDRARKTHESMLAQYAQLQQQSSTTPSGVASEEVVKNTVAELIAERKRRSGMSSDRGGGGGGGGGLLNGISFREGAGYDSVSPSPSSSTIFPTRDYRQRSAGLEALARAAAMQRGENMTVAELMMQQMQQGRREAYDHPSGSSGIPLRISDPEHLNKFIGLLNGEKEGSPLANPTGSNGFEHTFADFDHVPSLSVTEKILLISDYDGGIPEDQLALKYRVPVDKIPGIIRLRVPLIREQTRVFMERRRSSMRLSAIRALPVRRTNFVGLNIMMWRFFKDCRDRGIALTGRQLKEHAMTIASQLGLTNFKGSEGWLDAFKRRHKIDLRTMTGEAVNYESDPDGNIVCTSADGADDDDCSYDETTRSSSSPMAGDNPTDQLLASVTAIVNNEVPVHLPMMEDDGDRMGEGRAGSSGLQAFQPNYDDPRMAPDFRIDESSLITNIIRSTAVHVPNPEVARALDILRSYIVIHDPAAIGFFVDLQTRLASTIAANQTIDNCAASALGEAGPSSVGGVGLLNGVGGMTDAADQKTPPMVDGEPKEEESAESSVTSGEKVDEKENEEKGKAEPEEAAAASENGAVNSSHDSTTSEDSNDD